MMVAIIWPLFRPVDSARKQKVVQLGGDNPDDLVAAGMLCQKRGFKEVNLNLGCPAESARQGSFGAILMRPLGKANKILDPNLSVPSNPLNAASSRMYSYPATELVRALSSNLSIPVSVKIRLGVDHFDSYEFFRCVFFFFSFLSFFSSSWNVETRLLGRAGVVIT